MAPLLDILMRLEALLEPADFEDYCPNGLQVEGRGEVERLVSGVSASIELFERAIAEGADAILVHHGIFWHADNPAVVGALRERLRLLLGSEISLLAYHLPLDAHPTLGNNALIARALGVECPEPFGDHRGRSIGIRGLFPADGVAPAELVERVAGLTERRPLAFTDGPAAIRTMGIVSGAGVSNLDEAIALGLDAFLTGEPAERAMTQAREAGIHFIAAGHYATETFGVRALGDLLAAEYGIAHSFIDVPNPV